MARIEHALEDARTRAAARQVRAWEETERQLMTACFPAQRALVEDSHRRIAALVPRGGGKTTSVRVRFVRRLRREPKARLLYVATTRTQAEMLMWQPLKELNERLALGLRFNETKLRATRVRSGAQLQLVGADDKREVEKLRGQPYHEVWIDEAASHPATLLENLIFRIIGPRLGDYGGTLGMIGTPGRILAGPFYDATRPSAEIGRSYDERDDERYQDWLGWSVHRWSLEDNAAAPQLWTEAQLEKRANAWTDENPIWRREYLGQWAADDTENVYRYRAHLDGRAWNQWDPPRLHHARAPGGFAELPEGHEWRYVYGMDLGHDDPFALGVYAYADTCPDLLHVYEYERKGMTVRDVAALLIGPELDAATPGGLYAITGHPEGIVADTAGLGDMVLKELAEVYGIRVAAAEKKNKHDAIELWNGDLIDGRLKILKGSKLEQEQLHLQWAIDDFGRLKENRGQANHCSDAGIYARRCARHRHAAPAPAPRPAVGTREEANLRAREAVEQLSRPADEFGMFSSGDDFSDFFRGTDTRP